MTAYTIATTLNQPYAAAVEAVRAALADQGLGVLTEAEPSIGADATRRLTDAFAALDQEP